MDDLGNQQACPLLHLDRAGAAAAPRGAVAMGALFRRGHEGPAGAASVQGCMTPSGRPDRRIWRDTRADADDEISHHLEMRERDLIARGLPPPDARAEARRRFGSVEHITREVRSIDDRAARQQRRTGMWTDFRQDVIYALRGLRRAPGFTAVAVL